ncbi:cyclase family protein [Arenibaculum sp.]|uniref:cyclase family protein n=1 Tax=Arenibaculum sp. TaxID=2865862 RepID=UPI002E103B44|nr:cyclase family protein [Arenibaculum sp.]
MASRSSTILTGSTCVVAVCLGVVVPGAPATAQTPEQRDAVERSRPLVPQPPWPQGDQRGMANTQGPGTWLRCAQHLADPNARVYEISHPRSNTMPMSPFGTPLEDVYRPTASIPGTRHAFNGEETVSGEPGAQGTQMDALGHFAQLDEPWSGEGGVPADRARYYGGYGQAEVKPTPDSPLLKLGIEQVPPIVTSAVLLDARTHLGGGEPMEPGQVVTAADIEAMIEAQGLGWRGLLAGDVLYIYTGWGDRWQDPDTERSYYTMGPGLSLDAARYLEEKAIALVALDNPFTDPVAEGQLRGEAPPPAGTPEGMPFAIHHHNLVEAGIHNIQNANLAELAADRVWTSCTMILPLRSQGASGSPVRPVAIGAPNQS